MYDSETRVTPNDRVLLTELGDGNGVLLHLDTKFYYSLNPTGLHVWKQFGGRSKQVGDLVQAVVDTFDVASDQAGADVGQMLRDLAAEKLIVLSQA